MAEFKVIISDASTGKSSVKELKDRDAQFLVGMKIGDQLRGSTLGVEGMVKITGGSDRAGFPMRSDVRGGGKNRVLLSEGVGFRSAREGERRRRLVRGDMITDEIYQINMVLVIEGTEKVAEDTKTA